MSGHNKWSHQVQEGCRRANAANLRVSKEIIMAAKGGGDIELNASRAAAAKTQMPNDNIDGHRRFWQKATEQL